MQCGPIRHRMAERSSDLTLRLYSRETTFSLGQQEDIQIQEVFRCLVQNDARSALIEEDVSAALVDGRRCLILSHWKEHCQALADKLAQKGKAPFILSGGLGKKERTAILKSIQETPREQDLVVVATGQYVGEGFDCPQLYTLFLVFPVAFKGKLIQYVGRIMREFPEKADVKVYDYVDTQVPVLRNMYSRRQKTYKALGFKEGILK